MCTQKMSKIEQVSDFVGMPKPLKPSSRSKMTLRDFTGVPLKKKYAYFTKNNFTSVFKTLWDMCTPNLNQIEPASDAWDISTPKP